MTALDVDRMPEMSGPEMGIYLRRIRQTHTVAALRALAQEVEEAFPTDEATPRITGMIGVKTARLAEAN